MALRLILNSYDNLLVKLEAEDGEDIIQKLEETTPVPDILLLDLKMPKMNGIEAAKIIRAQFPDIKIIVLSTHFSRAFVTNMLEITASSYLPKNSEPEEVVETIEAVYAKGFHYNNKVMEMIRENMMSKDMPSSLSENS